MTVVRTNLGPHFGHTRNPLSFDDAYTHVRANPKQTFHATGNQTPFWVLATVGVKGEHAGERVLRFMSEGQERARAYHCCWGHQTNCNKTYINIYTAAIDPG